MRSARTIGERPPASEARTRDQGTKGGCPAMAGAKLGEIRAVLFDLDGTLLDINVEGFFPDYFARLAAYVAGQMPPEDFTPRLLRSTTRMIENKDASRTNQDVFMAEFFTGLEDRREVLMPLFDRFYVEEFPKLAKHATPVEGARAVVEGVLAGGRQAVIATAPVFPRPAIDERLRWAGLADLPFALVTTYENMHFAKPHPEYYAEIAARLGLRPRECLMVGNDVEEDLAAQDAGLPVFLAGPNIIHRGQRPCEPDYRGTLADLPGLLDGQSGDRRSF